MDELCKPNVKWVVELVQYQDGSVATLIPDGMTTVEQIELSLKARQHNLQRLNDLAERLLDEASKTGVFNDLPP